MSGYEKQNFATGQILKAEHMNKIEEGFEKYTPISDEITVGGVSVPTAIDPDTKKIAYWGSIDLISIQSAIGFLTRLLIENLGLDNNDFGAMWVPRAIDFRDAAVAPSSIQIYQNSNLINTISRSTYTNAEGNQYYTYSTINGQTLNEYLNSLTGEITFMAYESQEGLLPWTYFRHPSGCILIGSELYYMPENSLNEY